MPPASTTPAESVRLYLSPLTPELFSAYVPPQTQAHATEISYHNLETFPERSYGYVTLPVMDAAKVKSKLKGAILKGSKVRVEDARPRKRKVRATNGDEGEQDGPEESMSKDKTKKRRKTASRKGQELVIAGVELEDGRSVKRGWTEARADRSKRENKSLQKTSRDAPKPRPIETSKYTQEPEMLFRAKLPSNRCAVGNISGSGKQKTRKGKKTPTQPVVIHEFEKTQKNASFLRSAPARSLPSREFVEGIGWVDENGEVLEAIAAPSRQVSRATTNQKVDRQEKRKPEAKRSSQSGRFVNGSSSSSGSSSDSSSLPSDTESEASEGYSSVQSEAEAEAPVVSPPGGRIGATHPLEQLFKRHPPSPHKRPSPITTSFSFFGQADEQESADENDIPVVTADDGPQTPFAQHVNARNVSRSGAPTPDTAAVHRRFSFTRGAVESHSDVPIPSSDEPGINDGDVDKQLPDILSPVNEGHDDEEETNTINAEGSHIGPGGQEESAFATWFWQNRGDNNRKWKARRKEAMKEKRQREIRRLGRKII